MYVGTYNANKYVNSILNEWNGMRRKETGLPDYVAFYRRRWLACEQYFLVWHEAYDYIITYIV